MTAVVADELWISAVKAALDEGVVPGGGVTPVNLSTGLTSNNSDSTAAGVQLLKNALVQPFRQLMQNAGLNADELLPQVAGSKKTGMGFDVNNPSKLVELKTVGVVDPALGGAEAPCRAGEFSGRPHGRG